MTVIPIGVVGGAVARTGPVRRKAGGFHVADEAAPPAEAGPVAVVSVEAMLSLQEIEPASERDRRAHRHGEAMLAALGRLQHALLGDTAQPCPWQGLARLATSAPAAAADPALRAALDAITLRVHVELARRQASAGPQGGIA